jgi:hypothetical protein
MNKTYDNIWEFQSILSRRLLLWSIISIFGALILQIPRSRFTSGMGIQFSAWGLIDAIIAVFGDRSAKQRAARLPDPLAKDIVDRESQKLYKILLVNTGLDIGYMLGGSALSLTKGKADPGWRGHGIGIIIQGAFLFIFDLVHMLLIGRKIRD